ncbi:hypothetical protein [Mycobacterium branderi]|uniref:Pyridoxamine 5'-phosphate oxidase putative domain-containing protein n=1 Tax=Mycobacterium branderi TaxID=43348 RepID=A0A7I7WI75_9MYCO|nr:hypothetical protein [Mycobacterium branderi]MCV7231789.1 hypothetical protein [Mycobacterium branderi]ORA40251.1 hypothetical protein BST20_06760 [Mycobacterium branderi]BBZ15558.1 hypothetical protein MBRA_57530 [Mycobacterium branderi]
MDFSRLRLSHSELLRLLSTQTECTLSWLNPEGWPVAAVQTFVWHDDALWVTSFRDRPRVSLLAREPRSAVTVSSMGTPLEAQQMASARTVATVHDDESSARWFYPIFSQRVISDRTGARAMARALAEQDRVIIELRPQSWNTFRGARIRAG